MEKSQIQRIIVMLLILILSFSMNVTNALAADYTQGVDVSGNNATLWFKSTVNTSWVDAHYTVNSGIQQNVRMTYNSGANRYEHPIDSAAGAVIKYFFTYNNGSAAYDTGIFTYRAQRDSRTQEIQFTPSLSLRFQSDRERSQHEDHERYRRSLCRP